MWLSTLTSQVRTALSDENVISKMIEILSLQNKPLIKLKAGAELCSPQRYDDGAWVGVVR